MIYDSMPKVNTTPSASEPGIRRGLIIDLDYALIKNYDDALNIYTPELDNNEAETTLVKKI